jgi:FKBP-type peptidyl-prolyl cis-trans isomerase
VLYVGKFLNGTTFDKTSDSGRPLTFRVGRDQVVQGWDYIIQQMKRGERRLVIIPPELAYGTRGQPPRIPRNATLVFVMELVGIKPE